MRGRVALLGVLAAALSACTLLRGYAPHDEGLMLAAARRLADGQLPYRDFWWNYAPGQPLLLALLVKAFGPSLVAWRILRVAVDAVVSVLVYALVRRDAGHERLALLAWLAAAGAMAWPAGPGPNPTALALGLGALLAAPQTSGQRLRWAGFRRGAGMLPATRGGGRGQGRARARPGGWSGALAGLAVVFRPEIGVAALLGGVRRGRALAAFLGVAAAGLLPFFLAAPGDMWRDTVGFLGVQDMQRLPLPLAHPPSADPNKLLEYWFPAILVAGFALWLARRRWHPVAPLALVGLLYLLARTDEFHLVPLSIALTVLLAVEAGRASGAWRAALLVPLVLIAAHGLERRAGQFLHAPPQARVPGGAGDGVTTDPADAAALRRLVPLVRRLTPHREAIFVADPRHDRVTAGDPALYVILDRPNATRYDVMQPGVVTTAKVQREIVGDLPRVVVRWLDPRASAPEPNASAQSSGIHVLDRALARDYRRAARFGVYEVLVRREPQVGIDAPMP